MNTRKIRINPGKWACARHAITGLVAVGIVIGSPAPATGQARDARQLEDAMPAEYAVQVREIAREAGEAGVPPGLIARKAFEGFAKGYPPERVMTALDAYAGRLREARDLLGPDRRPASLAAAAEALRRGVPRDAIRSMGGRERGARDLAVPLIVLSDLTEAGVPTENALEMVNSAMDRGTRGDQMLGLSAAVRRRMQQGADWQTAVDAVRRRAGTQSRQRDRQSQPSRRPDSVTPVPPGSDPPQRQRDGG